MPEKSSPMIYFIRGTVGNGGFSVHFRWRRFEVSGEQRDTKMNDQKAEFSVADSVSRESWRKCLMTDQEKKKRPAGNEAENRLMSG